MKTELTPLEALENIMCFISVDECNFKNQAEKDKCYNIIETALKDYEKLSKQRYVIFTRTHQQKEMFIDEICKSYKEIKVSSLEDEKKLKALEIIKEKNIDVGAIKECVSAYAYNDFKELTETAIVKREKMTQEEYEIVKEVLL